MAKRGEILQVEMLGIMRQKSGHVSAYDLLEELRVSNPKIAPPTVYRALAALIDQGLVHRLESLNAYTLCQCNEHKHESILSICDDCGNVEENVEPSFVSNLTSLLGKAGFEAKRHVIEIHGVCASCGPEKPIS